MCSVSGTSRSGGRRLTTATLAAKEKPPGRPAQAASNTLKAIVLPGERVWLTGVLVGVAVLLFAPWALYDYLRWHDSFWVLREAMALGLAVFLIVFGWYSLGATATKRRQPPDSN
jgi:hypothetical protein